MVGKIALVGKNEVGKLARSGDLKVGIVVESGKVSRESDGLETCSREKDVAPQLFGLNFFAVIPTDRGECICVLVDNK